MITGRERIKSASCNCINNCSTRVYDALSTTEYTNTNASAFSNSSCPNPAIEFEMKDEQKKRESNWIPMNCQMWRADRTVLLTLLPFWLIKNFNSDSSPFNTTEIFCSTVDSAEEKKRKKKMRKFHWSPSNRNSQITLIKATSTSTAFGRNTNERKWNRIYFQFISRSVARQTRRTHTLTCIFVRIYAFGRTKLWNKCRFANASTTEHVHTVRIDGAGGQTWWHRMRWRMFRRHWTCGQTVATRTLTPKRIATIDDACKTMNEIKRVEKGRKQIMNLLD